MWDMLIGYGSMRWLSEKTDERGKNKLENVSATMTVVEK
jgi:hypothetical protein